ncbi:MAG: hypothetical protein H0W64_01070 [Gammaproteobacteria bacterium]|nr:hypothetical protein [Gammaproteobacteria bacterium]
MTENLLQKLEEKMMLILSEVEELRRDVLCLTQENTELKLDREKYLTEKMYNERKLQDLLSLFDAVKSMESTVMTARDVAA